MSIDTINPPANARAMRPYVFGERRYEDVDPAVRVAIETAAQTFGDALSCEGVANVLGIELDDVLLTLAGPGAVLA